MLYVLSLPNICLSNMLEDIEIHLYDYQQRPYIAEEMN